TVDAAKMKSAADLSVIAEAYYKNGNYDTALVYYEQIYQKNQSRRILINMINLCLKLSMADMAESYLRDFIAIAPRDFYRHIFRYRIDKLREESMEVLIEDLELLREENYMEDWAYELAKLYHKSGQPEKCVAECDDIILWFGTGIYVERARGLRAINLAFTGTAGQEEEALVREVRRLMMEGKSREEVENFIEESTTPEGRNFDYSEEDYRNERYGLPPIYEEEGKDVIWNTREFGPITEEMIRQQNTMDLLRGMQVAQQIRMHFDENRETLVEELPEMGNGEPGRGTARLPEGGAGRSGNAWDAVDNPTGMSVNSTGTSGNLAEMFVNPTGAFGNTDAVSGNAAAAGITGGADRNPDAHRTDSQEAGADGAASEEQLVQRQPARKSLWERRHEHKERKRREREEREREERERQRREMEEEASRKEKEAEERLYRMLQEGEQEAELSNAVIQLTQKEQGAEGIQEPAAETGQTGEQGDTREFSIPEEYWNRRDGEPGGRRAAGGESAVSTPSETTGRSTAESEAAASAPAEPEGRPRAEKRADGKAEGTGEKAVYEKAGAETDAASGKAAEGTAEAEAESGEPQPLYQYPEDILEGVDPEETPELARRMKERGIRPEEFFAGFQALIPVRRQIFCGMEQFLDTRNKNRLVLITGDPRSGKTTLAKAFAKCAHTLGGLNSSRVAMIRGAGLNRMRITDRIGQLENTVLLVEHASELSGERVSELLSLLPEFAGSTAIVFEDERSRMNRLFRENGELEQLFQCRIHLPQWTAEDLFLQALSMLASKEYQMEQPVAEQFLENVRDQIEAGRQNACEAVHAYVGQVLEHAEKRMADTLRAFAREGRFQEADLLLIRASDL
ncbi:MAG: ATP-binding protein, partial [Lachnospiraceae bacterium]|nr:ATP-binding protein [Lachnospiraceae bacterium]